MDYRGVLLVTEKNHTWAAEKSGLSVETVKALYENDTKAGLVCTIECENPEQV